MQLSLTLTTQTRLKGHHDDPAVTQCPHCGLPVGKRSEPLDRGQPLQVLVYVPKRIAPMTARIPAVG